MSKIDKISLFEIFHDDNDLENISNVIKSGKKWAIGEYNKIFEDKLAEYFERKYCVTFNSGTSALHGLMYAYGLGPEDEVIVPSFTFISTANAPLFVGAKPVFADIEEQCLGLDPEDVKEKITNKTKAIIPIHYAGCPCLIHELKEIAEDYNLILIEDAAEAFGAKIGEQKVGTFGDSSMLSFCQNKIITTGEGGAIVTDSETIDKKLRLFRSHGRDEKSDYFSSVRGFEYIDLGYNLRMSNILAALGVSQISKVDLIIEKRRTIAELYLKKMHELKTIQPFVSPENFFHVYQLFTVFVEDKREILIDLLQKHQIPSKIYFEPVHLSLFYKKNFGYKKGLLPKTEEISKKVLSLPIYPTLSEKQIDHILKTLKYFEKEIY